MMTGRPLVLTDSRRLGLFAAAIEGNAIAAAHKPNYDRLLREFPNTLVHTSGPSSGLPEGQMGNSEVGHLNIGAGRVIYMDVTRIDLMIRFGRIFQRPDAAGGDASCAHGRRLHLMGLLSDGGVHSMNTHLYALLEMAKREGVTDVCVHCFMDGRDTPPESGAGFHRSAAAGDAAHRRGPHRDAFPAATTPWIATSAGTGSSARRTAMVDGAGEKATDPVAAVKRSYERGVTDEFIEPIVTIVDARHEPGGPNSCGGRVHLFQLPRRSRPRDDAGA